MYLLEFFELITSFFVLVFIGEQIHRNAFETGFSGFSRVFLNLFTGLFFVVSGFAVYKTGGVTINIIVFLFFIGALLHSKFWRGKQVSFDFKPNIYIGLTALPLLLFFAWRLYTIVQPETELPVVVNMDSMKHVIRANFLVEFGIESINVNYLHPPSGVDPYHYFEAWTIALFGTLFKNNFWIIEQLVVFPLFSSIIVSGFWGIISRFNARPLAYFLGLLAPQFSGLYIEQFETFKYLSFSGGFRTNAFDEWKGFTVSVAYLVVLLFLNLLIRIKNPINALMVLTLLPIVSITLLPATFSAIILCIAILFLLKKRLNFVVTWLDWVIPIGVFLYITLFYQMFESREAIIEKPGLLENLILFMDPARIKLAIILWVEKFMQGVIYFSLVLLLSAIYFFRHRDTFLNLIKDKAVQIWWIFTFAILICGMFFWQVFYQFFGSGQFLFYSSMPIINISILTLLAFICIHINTVKSRVIYGFGVVVLMLFFWHRSHSIFIDGKQGLNDRYSHEYISKALVLIGNQKNVNGFKLVNDNRIIKWDENDHLAGDFLVGYYEQVNLYNLNFANYYFRNIIKDSEAAMMLPFSGIVTHDRSLGFNQSREVQTIVLDLIKNHEFKWLFVDKDQLIPTYLKERIRLMAVDSLSGEQMYCVEKN
jgi:hypothetical protein